MGINAIIQKFQSNLASAINQSGLPPAIIRIILENLINQVKEIERRAIEAEVKEGDGDG